MFVIYWKDNIYIDAIKPTRPIRQSIWSNSRLHLMYRAQPCLNSPIGQHVKGFAMIVLMILF